MKTKTININNIDILFYIGQNKNENFEIIDMANENDLWFHASGTSSCHVIASIPLDIDKNLLNKIIIQGSLLCKINTNKLKNINNVNICYTQIKNITKTNIIGMVNTKNTKIISI